MSNDTSEEIYEKEVVINEFSFNYVSLTPEVIDCNQLIERTKSSRAGAVSTFFGTTRDNFDGKEVTHLEYEAYPEMALKCMLEICDKARAKWDLINIVFQHKLGPCPILDVSIAIVVSSAHRKESLAAVEFAINELKNIVPIWKKEFYNEGEASWKANEKTEQTVPGVM